MSSSVAVKRVRGRCPIPAVMPRSRKRWRWPPEGTRGRTPRAGPRRGSVRSAVAEQAQDHRDGHLLRRLVADVLTGKALVHGRAHVPGVEGVGPDTAELAPEGQRQPVEGSLEGRTCPTSRSARQPRRKRCRGRHRRPGGGRGSKTRVSAWGPTTFTARIRLGASGVRSSTRWSGVGPRVLALLTSRSRRPQPVTTPRSPHGGRRQRRPGQATTSVVRASSAAARARSSAARPVRSRRHPCSASRPARPDRGHGWRQ